MGSSGRFEQLFFKVLKENNTAGAGGSLGEPNVPYANDDARIPKLLGQGKVQTRKGSTGGKKKNKKKKTDGLDGVFLTGEEGEEDLGQFCGPGGCFKVWDTIKWAEETGRKEVIDLQDTDNILTKAVHNDIDEWWQGDDERMMKSDTKWPILMLVEPDGKISIADGLNRAKKLRDVEKKKTIQANVVKREDIPEEFKVGTTVPDGWVSVFG